MVLDLVLAFAGLVLASYIGTTLALREYFDDMSPVSNQERRNGGDDPPDDTRAPPSGDGL